MAKWGQSGDGTHPATEISTLLGKDTEIRGSIKTQGSIRIDGSVMGEVQSAKTVTIGPGGFVEGDITAENIIVGGKVKGSLTARSRISLEGSAQLDGDLNAVKLSIAEGAGFRGRSNMGSPATPPRRAEAFVSDDATRQPNKITAD